MYRPRLTCRPSPRSAQYIPRPGQGNRPPPPQHHGGGGPGGPGGRPNFRDMPRRDPPPGYICYRCGQKGALPRWFLSASPGGRRLTSRSRAQATGSRTARRTATRRTTTARASSVRRVSPRASLPRLPALSRARTRTTAPPAAASREASWSRLRAALSSHDPIGQSLGSLLARQTAC